MFAIKSLCTFLLLSTSFPEYVSGWKTLGSAIIPESLSSTDSLVVGGNAVDASQDGRRVAVGVPDAADGTGAVFVYELTDEVSWKLLVTLYGSATEGLGTAISLSPDGQLVAVRRQSPSNHVQVFLISPENGVYVLRQVGSNKICPESSFGQSVTLGQAFHSSFASMEEKYWLVFGCESYDNGRGSVQIHHLHQDTVPDTYEWIPFVAHLNGSDAGDGFGSAIALVHAPSVLSPTGLIVRLAISSPGHNNGQGRVQVFVATIGAEEWEQQGVDLAGTQVGETFGSSLDVSTGEYPYVVIGSPKYTHTDGSQGMVRLYHWRSPAFGVSPLWQLVDAVYNPDAPNEFGKSVSMSSDGNRLAASTRSSVAVYELEDYYNLKLVSDLIQSSGDGQNTKAALNGPGSVVVSTWSTGEVMVHMDDTSFCKVPLLDETLSSMDTFLERATCRENGIRRVATKDQCAETTVYYMNGMRNCEWIPSFETASATMTPSVTSSSNEMPTIAPSMKPSLKESNNGRPQNHPTSMPSVDTSSTPTETYETHSPSSKTMEPSGDFFGSPSTFPSSADDSTTPPPNVDFELLSACHCNENFACTNSRLKKDAKVLRICINKKAPGFVILDLAKLKMVQGHSTVSVVENATAIADGVSTQCNQNSCRIQLPAHSDLFASDRPPYVAVSGEVVVSSERRNLRLRRKLLEKFLQFGTVISLEQGTLATESKVDTDIEEKTSRKGMSPLLWLIVALVLVLVGMVAGRTYLKLKRPQQ
eukprot:scaffold2042_cov123-Cylindrotheca_fusiformis.AAC.12